MPENPRRLVILCVVLALLAAWNWWPRHWHPTLEISTDHYAISSTATPEQTKAVAQAVEALYAAYHGILTNHLDLTAEHAKLRLQLFKNRQEFRRCHRNIGWAEALYRTPNCSACFSAEEINPCHWMLHEAVHQLNHEVAHLHLAQWMDEGFSEYLSTSILKKGKLHPGWVDPNTYPIWWLDDLSLTGNLTNDIAHQQIIPLRAIVSGRDGPNINKYFNLYYIHWWSLSHFLIHGNAGEHRIPFLQVLKEGGSLSSFEIHFGPIDRVQDDWYRYLLDQREKLKHGPFLEPDAPIKEGINQLNPATANKPATLPKH